MSGIQIVREQRIGVGPHGQDVVSDEAYVKISVSLREFLKQFKGARLSAFLALAVNESEICLGHGTALSIYDIADQTDFSERNVLRAVQYLCENHFAVELSERGARAEKLYRVAGFAWFGNPRAQPPASNRGTVHQQSPASNRGYDKTSDPSLLGTGDASQMSEPAPNVIGMTKDAPVVVVLKESIDPKNSTKKQQQTDPTTRQILVAAGVAEPALSELSSKISAECAHAWFEEWASNAPKSFTNPIAYAIKTLREHCDAMPAESKRNTWWSKEYDQFVNR